MVNPQESCSYALEKKPCRFCTFWRKQQAPDGPAFEEAVARLGEFKGGRIEIFINGSVFDERQLAPGQLKRMLELTAGTQADTITVESRPEYITPGRIRLARQAIGAKHLEVMIGLETFEEKLRLALGKGMTDAQVGKTLDLIARENAFPALHLLTGLLAPEMGMRDLLSSAAEARRWQEMLGVPIRLALEAFFPTGFVHMKGRAAGASPEFVAQAAKSMVTEHGLLVFIALSAEGLGTHPLEAERARFERFNATQEVSSLDEIIAGKRFGAGGG